MKAKELQERTSEDLGALLEQLRSDLFSYRMKNSLGQLDDTSLIPKRRRDIARVEGILASRKVVAATNAESTAATPQGSQS